jgi:hypothetical protein
MRVGWQPGFRSGASPALARRGKHAAAGSVALWLVAVGLTGCAAEAPGPPIAMEDERSAAPAPNDGEDAASGWEEHPGPWDEHALTDPELLFAEPDEAVPGQKIELYFPAGTMRGLAFVLEEREASDWVQRYMLVAPSAGGPGAPEPEPWWVPYGQDLSWDDVGIDGRRPDLLVVPSDARPGEYRICTANTPGHIPNLCAALTVRAP